MREVYVVFDWDNCIRKLFPTEEMATEYMKAYEKCVLETYAADGQANDKITYYDMLFCNKHEIQSELVIDESLPFYEW